MPGVYGEGRSEENLCWPAMGIHKFELESNARHGESNCHSFFQFFALVCQSLLHVACEEVQDQKSPFRHERSSRNCPLILFKSSQPDRKSACGVISLCLTGSRACAGALLGGLEPDHPFCPSCLFACCGSRGISCWAIWCRSSSPAVDSRQHISIDLLTALRQISSVKKLILLRIKWQLKTSISAYSTLRSEVCSKRSRAWAASDRIIMWASAIPILNTFGSIGEGCHVHCHDLPCNRGTWQICLTLLALAPFWKASRSGTTNLHDRCLFVMQGQSNFQSHTDFGSQASFQSVSGIVMLNALQSGSMPDCSSFHLSASLCISSDHSHSWLRILRLIRSLSCSFSVPEEAPFTAVLKYAAEEVLVF